MQNVLGSEEALTQRAPTCLFRPGREDTSWKTATLPEAVPAATRSSKQLSSFTTVMDSVFPCRSQQTFRAG